MVNGKTNSGFEFFVDETIMEDVEFLERFARVQNGDGLEIFGILEDLLGKDQKESLYNYIRNEKGRVLLPRLSEELSDIVGVLNTDDNSKN